MTTNLANVKTARKPRHGFMRRLMYTYVSIFTVIVVCIMALALVTITGVSNRVARISREQLCAQMAAQTIDYLDAMMKMAEQVSQDSRIMSMFQTLNYDSGPVNTAEAGTTDGIAAGASAGATVAGAGTTDGIAAEASAGATVAEAGTVSAAAEASAGATVAAGNGTGAEAGAAPENYFDQDILARLEIGSILESYNSRDMQVGNILDSYNSRNMRVWRISLFDAKGNFVSRGAPVDSIGSAADRVAGADTQELFARLKSSPKTPVILTPREDRWSQISGKYISLVYSLSSFYGSEVYGAVEVQQPLDVLTGRLALDSDSGITVNLLDGGGRRIWPDGGGGDIVDVQNGGADGGGIVGAQDGGDGGGADDKGQIAAYMRLPQYNWTLALLQSRESILKPFYSVILYLLIGGGLLVMAMTVAVYLISRHVSAPLVGFTRRVSTASLGALPDNWPVEEDFDELHELGTAFSTMMERLNAAVILEKKAYLHALQAQMNPHFLYNSLAMLSAISMEGGNNTVAYACERLSGLMRYTADASASTLDMEIGNVRDYLEIMKLRYEDYFNYEISTKGDLCGVATPRLILQPIAENCFEHAFKDVEPPWKVVIRAEADGNNGWEVSVADNGCGFDGARLDELERSVALYTTDLPKNFEALHPGRMGLLNTIVRLKMQGGITCEIKRCKGAASGAEITIRGHIGGAVAPGTDNGATTRRAVPGIADGGLVGAAADMSGWSHD